MGIAVQRFFQSIHALLNFVELYLFYAQLFFRLQLCGLPLLFFCGRIFEFCLISGDFVLDLLPLGWRKLYIRQTLHRAVAEWEYEHQDRGRLAVCGSGSEFVRSTVSCPIPRAECARIALAGGERKYLPYIAHDSPRPAG